MSQLATARPTRYALIAALGAALLLTILLVHHAGASTTISANNGLPWDVNDKVLNEDFCGGDTSFSFRGDILPDDKGGQDPEDDDGAIERGGDSSSFSFGEPVGGPAFDCWGALQVQVKDAFNNVISEDYMHGFGLTWDGNRSWSTTTPVFTDDNEGDIKVERSIYAPADKDYLRYVDGFTNTGSQARTVTVTWGSIGDLGELGSHEDTQVAGTSNGDTTIAANDVWAVTIGNPALNADGSGESENPAVGYVFRLATDGTSQGTAEGSAPFTEGWSGNGDGQLAYKYTFTIPAGKTIRLMYFLIQKPADIDRQTCISGANNVCIFPITSTSATLAAADASNLAAHPDYSNMSAAVKASIINWPAGGDLRIDKAGNPAVPVPGRPISFRIRVRNDGPGSALGVAMTDVLPTGMIMTSTVTAPAGWNCAGSPLVGKTGTVVCQNPTVLQGSSAIFSFSAIQPTGPDGTKKNVATVKSTQSIDPNLANNSAIAQATLP